MSESIIPPTPEEREPKVSPYNLNDFPAYKSELLSQGGGNTQESIQQTFKPTNPDELLELTSREISDDLTPDEHEELFDALYPGLSEVYRLEQGQQSHNLLEARRSLAIEERLKYKSNPDYFDNYWATKASNEPDENTKVTYERNHQALNQLTRELLSDDATLAVASEWYLHLGSLSNLDGAEAMLVYAAHLPLEPRADKRGSQRHKFSLATQRLTAGCMLAEAARVNDYNGNDVDYNLQSQYEEAALNVLRPVIQSSTPEAQNAFAISNGIKSRRAGVELRRGRLLDDRTLVDASKREAQTAQDELGAYIEQLDAERLKTSDRQVQGEYNGALTELAVVYYLRESYIRRDVYDRLDAHQAFPRQDWPHDGLVYRGLPREAADLIITSRNRNRDGAIAVTQFPFQVKFGQAGRQKEYNQEIMVLAGQGNIDQLLPPIKKANKRIPGSASSVQEVAAPLERACQAGIRARAQNNLVSH